MGVGVVESFTSERITQCCVCFTDCVILHFELDVSNFVVRNSLCPWRATDLACPEGGDPHSS